mmetsp:Transcript_20322/g.36292  ORF Transcript_20322/g.36292 Transcript_20322/m.36292 type:complete len:686 (-) Transcript_20322:45-2102(-)
MPVSMGCAPSSLQSHFVQGHSVSSDKQDATNWQPVTPRAESRVAESLASGASAASSNAGNVIVMGKYITSKSKEDYVGEGSSSVCRKGISIATGEAVAIKVYKAKSSKSEEVRIQNFVRQVAVLKKLQEPFDTPADQNLWHPDLAAKPVTLFMQILDYSQDEDGNPAPDPADGIMYVVTELAQYSLKDYLALRRERGKRLSQDSVKNITKAILMIVAGLHAKGLVHLDLKPENLMMFNGRLKLIDVDGCMQIGSEVSVQDPSISFSPCYCAPEWANFMIDENQEQTIDVQPHLDVWSVGITVAELVTLDAILKPMYSNFLRNGHSHREAFFLFMDWLGSIRLAPLPPTIKRFDPNMHKFLTESLLVPDHNKRKTLAQCLSHAYFQQTTRTGTEESDAMPTGKGAGQEVKRGHRPKLIDSSSKAPLYKGVLWKLNSNGNPEEAADWLKRDMWVACNGSLCYWSIKESKRLVLLDGAQLGGATVEPFKGAARSFAFTLQCPDPESDHDLKMWFAAESAEEFKIWEQKLSSAANLDGVLQTVQLGQEIAKDMAHFRLNVKHRRLKVGEDQKDQFAPAFKARLWKLKADGNRKAKEDWFQRDVWISKNGSLVYWSKKEDRAMVYYTADDIAKAKFVFLPNEETYQPWAFQVKLPPNGDIEFAAGEFAALSEVMRECWIEEFQKFQAHGV